MEKITLLWFWTNRDKVEFSLNKLYSSVDLSKQAMHEWLDRYFAKEDEWEQLVMVIREIRVEHPGLGSRKLYVMIQPQTMGRDQFIERCHQNGFKLELSRSATRTTNSLGVTRFPNLIINFKRIWVNKVWVSDITFYRIGEKFYYLTFIMDMKSKFIVGFAVSKRLTTDQTTLIALMNALKFHRPGKGTILHSDGGGQYYCKEFVAMTKKHLMKNSMAQTNSENNHAERVNGTIKNQYLSYYMPTSFDELVKNTERAVFNYNYSRPHETLNNLTPADVYGFSTKNPVINKEKKKQKKKFYNNNYIYKNIKKAVKAI
jgi:transposase InsO family protein